MTTTGQFLVANSTLPSGTALQHLLALQIGAGSGQTVFASQLAVSIETPRTEFSRKVKRGTAPQPVAQPQVKRSEDQKTLYCSVGSARLDAAVESDEMWVRIGTQSVVSTVKAERTNYTKKGIA